MYEYVCICMCVCGVRLSTYVYVGSVYTYVCPCARVCYVRLGVRQQSCMHESVSVSGKVYVCGVCSRVCVLRAERFGAN